MTTWYSAIAIWQSWRNNWNFNLSLLLNSDGLTIPDGYLENCLSLVPAFPNFTSPLHFLSPSLFLLLPDFLFFQIKRNAKINMAQSGLAQAQKFEEKFAENYERALRDAKSHNLATLLTFSFVRNPLFTPDIFLWNTLFDDAWKYFMFLKYTSSQNRILLRRQERVFIKWDKCLILRLNSLAIVYIFTKIQQYLNYLIILGKLYQLSKTPNNRKCITPLKPHEKCLDEMKKTTNTKKKQEK